MTYSARLLLLALVVSQLKADFIATGVFYDPATAQAGWLASVNEASGQARILSFGSGPSTDVGGLALDPVSSTFFVARGGGLFQPSYIDFFTLADTTPRLIAPLSQNLFFIRALAVSPQGSLLYAADGSTLFSINPGTGQVIRIANMGPIGTVTGLAFGPDGMLYGYTLVNRETGTHGVGLFRFDLATGQTTVLTPAGKGGSVDVNGLSFAPDGTLWGVQGNFNTGYYNLDPGTGLLLDNPPRVVHNGTPTGIAFLPAATVPEPGLIALFGLGLTGLYVRRRLYKS